jgi:hypothetical protein
MSLHIILICEPVYFYWQLLLNLVLGISPCVATVWNDVQAASKIMPPQACQQGPDELRSGQQAHLPMIWTVKSELHPVLSLIRCQDHWQGRPACSPCRYSAFQSKKISYLVSSVSSGPLLYWLLDWEERSCNWPGFAWILWVITIVLKKFHSLHLGFKSLYINDFFIGNIQSNGSAFCCTNSVFFILINCSRGWNPSFLKKTYRATNWCRT